MPQVTLQRELWINGPSSFCSPCDILSTEERGSGESWNKSRSSPIIQQTSRSKWEWLRMQLPTQLAGTVTNQSTIKDGELCWIQEQSLFITSSTQHEPFTFTLSSDWTTATIQVWDITFIPHSYTETQTFLKATVTDAPLRLRSETFDCESSYYNPEVLK